MDASRLSRRLNLLGPWLRRRFGGPVVKIGLDAGFGCPNRDHGGGCLFCPPAAYGRQGPRPTVAQQLDQGLTSLRAKARRGGCLPPLALAYFQAYSSTHAPAEVLEQTLATAVGRHGVCGVIVSTRPDCLDQGRWDVLSSLAQKTHLWLELGLQSAHDPTLAAIGRGHDVACFDAAVAEAGRRGIAVAAHVILGLPGEGPEQTNATAQHLAKLGLWGVKLHNLMVLGGASLADRWRAGGFEPWSRERYAQVAAAFLARLPAKTLVHRLVADPRDDRLLAPAWAADKNRALAAVADELERQDIRQGELCPPR